MPEPTLHNQLMADFTAAIREHPGLRLDMDAQSAFLVVAALQLALRHPGYPPDSRMQVERFTRGLCDRLASKGPLKVALEMGWNPDLDETDVEYADPEHREAVAAEVFARVEVDGLAGMAPRVDQAERERSAGNSHTIESTGFRITELYAFLAIDAADDAEGVCGFMGNDGWMPMVCADRARVESLRRIAVEISADNALTVTLARFHEREDVEVIRG